MSQVRHEIEYIIVDLDRTFGINRAFERKPGEDTLEHNTRLLDLLKIVGVGAQRTLIFLTARGVEQLPLLVSFMHAGRFNIGESGAAAFDSAKNTIVRNPRFSEYRRAIHYITKAFYKRFGFDAYGLEPGVLSCIRVERYSPDVDMGPIKEFFDQVGDMYGATFVAGEHGDCIDFKPAITSKEHGITFLAKLHEQAGTPIDFSKALWLGDSKTDIPAAEYIAKAGGYIAAVGNASHHYKMFVETHGGYIAQRTCSDGACEILEHFLIS